MNIREAMLTDPGRLAQAWRVAEGISTKEDEGLPLDWNVTVAHEVGNNIIALTMPTKRGELQWARSVASGGLRRWDLDAETRAALQDHVDRLSAAVGSTARASRAKGAAVEAEEVPGVYVYSFPHYLAHPIDSANDRTLLKVGHSARGTIRRFMDQTRTTGMPEDPVLLRIYATEDSHTIEQRFHTLLEAFGHDRRDARAGGTEWFVTNLRALDATADVLGLKVHYAVAI